MKRLTLIRRVRGLVVITFSALVLCVCTPSLFAQAQTIVVHVTGGEDNTTADGFVTLREAILISEGKLNRVLTPAEQAQVTTRPSTSEVHTILLDVDCLVDDALPGITKNGTIITSSSREQRTITGNGKHVKVGLYVTGARFEIAFVDLKNFEREIIIDESKAKPEQSYDIRILNVGFSSTKEGLQFKGPPGEGAGKRKMNSTCSTANSRM